MLTAIAAVSGSFLPSARAGWRREVEDNDDGDICKIREQSFPKRTESRRSSPLLLSLSMDSSASPLSAPPLSAPCSASCTYTSHSPTASLMADLFAFSAAYLSPRSADPKKDKYSRQSPSTRPRLYWQAGVCASSGRATHIPKISHSQSYSWPRPSRSF